MKRRPAIFAICSLLALVTLACYWPVTAHKFVSLDDHEYIYENPHVKAGLTWSGVLWAFQSGYASNWHPLTWISHMLDCQLYGLNPAGHHLTNLVFHTANTLLLFLLLQRITGSLWRSACVAALFAWHPLHVESVAWASERKDVLSTFFFLLTIWAYARYAKGGSENAECRNTQHATRNTRHASRYYILSLSLFVLGLMSKPMVVTLPFVLLLLDLWPLQRLQLPALQGSRFKLPPPSAVLLRRTGGSGFEAPTPVLTPQSSTLWPLVREKLPFFALALAASVVTYLVQQTGGAVSSLDILPLQSRLANALVVYVRYISQCLWPAHLAAIYPYSRHLPVGAVVAAGLLLAGLSAWFALRTRRHPFLMVGWLWYLGTLVPTIGLIQVGSQSMADRYMYIPSIGLFLVVVCGVDTLPGSWPHKRYLLAAAGTLALGGCLVCTWCQLKYWQDSERLYRHAIAATTDNYIAYDGLGNALGTSGKVEEAIACYAEAVRLKPNYPEGQYDLGSTLMKQGRLDEAVQHLTAAVKHDQAFAHAHINLGATLLKQGKLDEAIVCFSEALRLNPDYGEAHGNLGIALMRQGKLSEGAAHLSAALRLNPNNPEAHYNLGLALLELNHPRDAADQFAEALRLNPDAAGPHYHLAIALIRQEKTKEALAHAEKARDLALAAGQTALAAKADELLKQHP